MNGEKLPEKVRSQAGAHFESLSALFEKTPEARKKGMLFLITHMTENDLKSIDTEMLAENVDCAYQAKARFPWAKDVPEEIFLNDVLPYAVMDETREKWRKSFLELFGKKVEKCSTAQEAIEAINRNIQEDLQVRYNTLRKKPNQSPQESMEIHMASCTGLAILLVDAFRSVGIPSRFAGTASWHDNRGNHSWVEVWKEGKWYITEYVMPPALDRPWFLANTGKADPEKREYRIYATSYKPTGDSFPMVWDMESKDVHGVDVTQRYIELSEFVTDRAKRDGSHAEVAIRMFRDDKHKSQSGDRVSANVDVFDGDLQMDGGRTASPEQDMNDILTFLLPRNRSYVLKYQDTLGKDREIKVKVEDKPVTVDAYME